MFTFSNSQKNQYFTFEIFYLTVFFKFIFLYKLFIIMYKISLQEIFLF